MPKVAVRKRLVRKKSQRVPHSVNDHESSTDELESADIHVDAPVVAKHSENFTSSVDFCQAPMNHDYCSRSSEDQSSVLLDSDFSDVECPSSVPADIPTLDLLLDMKKKIDLFLPHRWLSIVDKEVLHVLFISIQKTVSVQRSLVVSPNGSIQLFVHNQSIDIGPYTRDLNPPMPLDCDTVNSFVDGIVSIVNSVRTMEVCAGYDEERFRAAWSTCPLGEIDTNPHLECRYVETFRSSSCLRLVPFRKWRCSQCLKLYGPLKRRAKSAAEKERHINTANKYLTEEQKLKKLSEQRSQIENARKKLMRLQARMQEVIKKESFVLEQNLSDDLTDIMRNSDSITPAQSVFLQQQIKASQQKNSCGMRWHATMIRFALALHLTSPAAYKMVQQTGMVKLPSTRTLFDYSRVKPVEEGIDKVVVESLAQRVSKFDSKQERHKKFHILMADEMYISQNLVFQKSTGKMIGYTSLDHVDSEVKNLEHIIDNPDKEMQETVATKVLVYMVKGVSNGIKEVVATFAVGNLSANQLYVWTWKVIGVLERSGIAVAAFVSDGSSVNRSFIKKHKPATPNEYKIVCDTWNKAARERKLFFIADVPHLLKTIRNCMFNSRWDGRKSRRKMMKNGQKITWDIIIRLYELKKGKNLRKSYKLNAMNVYPDSYARMKVKLAGQPLSGTVCKDIRCQNWPDAVETALFIEYVNDWFDCLNGAHSFMAKRTANTRIAAYTMKDDPRFALLDKFMLYLKEWEMEAHNYNTTLSATILANTSANVDTPGCDESEIEDGGFDPECDTPASKRLLSAQTVEGIRMTTLAFKPLVHFLLDEGTTYINARIFTQDPLEQHFSKVRAGQGGSNNPNVGQVLNRNRALHTIGQLGMKKRKGNSGEDMDVVEVTCEKLPKRQCVRVPKFS